MTEKASGAIMIATKDIKIGEEVYTTYAPPHDLRMPKDLRHDFLGRGSWFGPKVCECRRCSAEDR